ncbi:MAG: DUF4249 domain-containing protein [Bacteroidota bacterium]
MQIKPIQQLFLFLFLLLLNGCIVQFIPETSEDQNLLVVEGLITDQPGPNTIKLSKSLPLGGISSAKPLDGCNVTISDDLGNSYNLNEKVPGTYLTNPSDFQGVVGRSYTLHIKTNTSDNNLSYQSFPMQMKPVPPIDSIYYEKSILQEKYPNSTEISVCQIYLDTHDPENNCKFYRWEYIETWEFRLPYMVPNFRCWISGNSDKINIKSTSSFAEARINGYPLNYISNTTDRLKEKYSILVNQYSLNEDEYTYWEKLQNITEQVGGLYDITPASIPSNIWCVENSNEKVLGYFSVSASTSKRIFIKDRFLGIVDLYNDCIADTIMGGAPIPNLGTYVWVIIDHPIPPPSYRVITRTKGCYDCTVRGTNVEPIFWRDDKKLSSKGY